MSVSWSAGAYLGFKLPHDNRWYKEGVSKSCGHDIADGQKFCPECGANAEPVKKVYRVFNSIPEDLKKEIDKRIKGKHDIDVYFVGDSNFPDSQPQFFLVGIYIGESEFPSKMESYIDICNINTIKLRDSLIEILQDVSKHTGFQLIDPENDKFGIWCELDCSY